MIVVIILYYLQSESIIANSSLDVNFYLSLKYMYNFTAIIVILLFFLYNIYVWSKERAGSLFNYFFIQYFWLHDFFKIIKIINDAWYYIYTYSVMEYTHTHIYIHNYL